MMSSDMARILNATPVRCVEPQNESDPGMVFTPSDADEDYVWPMDATLVAEVQLAEIDEMDRQMRDILRGLRF